MNRELRVRQMQTSTTGAITSNTITLPDDCREIQSLRVACGTLYTEIFPLPPERLADTVATGFPSGYVVVNGDIKTIGGSGSEDYAMTYWQAIPALSDSATQNWLILREPGLYLYGALAETAPFLREDERLITWGTLYNSIRDGMALESDNARYGNAPAMRLGFNAP